MSIQVIHLECGDEERTLRVTYAAGCSGDGWNEPREFDLEIISMTIDGVDLGDKRTFELAAQHFNCRPVDAQEKLLDLLASDHDPSEEEPDWDYVMDLRADR